MDIGEAVIAAEVAGGELQLHARGGFHFLDHAYHAGTPQLLNSQMNGQTSAPLTLPAVRALAAGGYFAIVVNGGAV